MGRGVFDKLVNTKHDAHTFADRQWSNRPDSENSDNGTGIPINATLFNVGARRSVTAATASAETSVAVSTRPVRSTQDVSVA